MCVCQRDELCCVGSSARLASHDAVRGANLAMQDEIVRRDGNQVAVDHEVEVACNRRMNDREKRGLPLRPRGGIR